MDVKGIKIKKVSIVLFVLAVACLVLLIPAVQGALIAFAEGTLLKRKLGLPAMWLTAMRLCGIAGIVFFAALVYLIQTEKEALPEQLFERHAKTIGIALTAVYSLCAAGFCFISADIWVDEAYTYSLLSPASFKLRRH